LRDVPLNKVELTSWVGVGVRVLGVGDGVLERVADSSRVADEVGSVVGVCPSSDDAGLGVVLGVPGAPVSSCLFA
jgi:hypothetical protein